MTSRRRIPACLVLTALLLAALGCSLPFLPGSGPPQELWPDVPILEGVTQDAAEAFGAGWINQSQMDPQTRMETRVFRTGHSPADVAGFYTSGAMQTRGWAPGTPDPGGCLQETAGGLPLTVCRFTRPGSDGGQVELIIDARPDPKAGNTRLVFLRITARPAAAP